MIEEKMVNHLEVIGIGKDCDHNTVSTGTNINK